MMTNSPVSQFIFDRWVLCSPPRIPVGFHQRWPRALPRHVPRGVRRVRTNPPSALRVHVHLCTLAVSVVLLHTDHAEWTPLSRSLGTCLLPMQWNNVVPHTTGLWDSSIALPGPYVPHLYSKDTYTVGTVPCEIIALNVLSFGGAKTWCSHFEGKWNLAGDKWSFPHPGGGSYALYGDSGYPLKANLFSPNKATPLSEEEQSTKRTWALLDSALSWRSESHHFVSFFYSFLKESEIFVTTSWSTLCSRCVAKELPNKPV